MTARSLRMLYRDIPPGLRCVPNCGRCCGPVPWSAAELARVTVPPGTQRIEIAGVQALQSIATGMCPFLQPDKRCAVYDHRPFMCRLFGAAPQEARLRCPEGATPARSLSPERARNLTDRYREISR